MPFSNLTSDIRDLINAMIGDKLVPGRELSAELEQYVRTLYVRSEFEAHFDTRTALSTIEVCRSLLRALPPEPTEKQHRLTQVAIRYFVLEDDADSDADSMVGFDDDLQVAMAVVEALGLPVPDGDITGL